MASEEFFNQSFEVVNQDYGWQQGKEQYNIKKVIQKDIHNQIVQENLILIEFQKQQLNLNEFTRLMKLKYVSFIQPTDIFENNKYFKIVYPDVLPYQMNEQKLDQIKQTNGAKMFLLQLILTFSELNRRGLVWALQGISQIYLIKNTIFFCLLDYSNEDNNNINNQNYLVNFFIDYFPDQPELCQIAVDKGINGLEEYILKQTNFDAINWLNPPYENVFASILSIENFESIFQSQNSEIKQFATTQALKIVLSPTIAKDILYKSTKFKNAQYEAQITLQIDREINNFEQFSRAFYIAKCYFYFRIKQYCFLVMKKYTGSARDLLRSWPKPGITKEQLRKQVYFFSYKFAQALNCLHKYQILHRDLKPENLLMDYMNLEIGEIYIVDFDRSKYLSGAINFDPTIQFSENTLKYDPPETPMNNPQQMFQYDIFQYGLIILEFANMGKYVGSQLGARNLSQNDFQNYYSRQAIKEKLKNIADYHDEFIDLISQCLQLVPNNRPTTNDVYNKTYKLYEHQPNQRAIMRIISQQPIN